MTHDAIKPCPLCGNKLISVQLHGIKCYDCDLWLGDGSKVKDKGGVVKVWNSRYTEQNK